MLTSTRYRPRLGNAPWAHRTASVASHLFDHTNALVTEAFGIVTLCATCELLKIMLGPDAGTLKTHGGDLLLDNGIARLDMWKGTLDGLKLVWFGNR